MLILYDNHEALFFDISIEYTVGVPMKKRLKKIYIGLVGEKGGGKDTVTKFLQQLLPKKKVVQIRFQDVLTETLNLWELPRARENYQKLSPAFRRAFGPYTLANVVEARAKRARADIVILNGMRWWEDLKMARSLNKNRGARSFVVYITAPARVRFERTKKRGEKAGEKNATFAKFLKQEKALTERFIKKIGQKADVVLENTGTLYDFEVSIKQHIIPHIGG